MPPPSRFERNTILLPSGEIRHSVARAIKREADRLSAGNLFDVKIPFARRAGARGVSQQLATRRKRWEFREPGIGGKPGKSPGRERSPRVVKLPSHRKRNEAGGEGGEPPPEMAAARDDRLFGNDRFSHEWNGRGLGTLQGSDKTISAARERFNVAGIFRRIAERAPKLIHCRVQAVLEIDKRPGDPNVLAQLLAGNHFAGMCQQDQ